uniref:Uncharacterized protein n=1 Tax=Avena sativa TaxID=4498 RepID=A0ACD5UQ56_AVESA
MAVQYNRRLVTAEDGGLGFASVDRTILTLFSMETGPNGAVGWVQRRVINLKSLLSDAGLLNPAFPSRLLTAGVNGFVEGTQLIFVGTFICVYMIDLKSGRITKVLDHGAEVLPHMSSCIPAMEAAST